MKTEESKPRGLILSKKYSSGKTLKFLSIAKTQKKNCYIEKRFSLHCSPGRALSFGTDYNMK